MTFYDVDARDVPSATLHGADFVVLLAGDLFEWDAAASFAVGWGLGRGAGEIKLAMESSGPSLMEQWQAAGCPQ